jgi:hypothetical protein
VNIESDPSSSGEIRRKATGSIPKPPQPPAELRLLLERLQALEERVRALPSLNQSTIVSSLDERLGAMPVPLGVPEISSLIAEKLTEKLATLDMEKLIAKELDGLVSRVLEELQPAVEDLVTVKLASSPPPPPPPAASGGAEIDPEAIKGLVDESINNAKAEILGTVDARSQQVATELIQGFGAAEKRMNSKLDEKIKTSVADYAGNFEEVVSQKITDTLGNFVNSAAFKDTLDKRFRVIIQHLEGDVIPRVVKNIIAQQKA